MASSFQSPSPSEPASGWPRRFMTGDECRWRTPLTSSVPEAFQSCSALPAREPYKKTTCWARRDPI
eukprot:1955710-Heterocapsa_arctica.AAC.1